MPNMFSAPAPASESECEVPREECDSEALVEELVEEVAHATDGFSLSDLDDLRREAGMQRLRTHVSACNGAARAAVDPSQHHLMSHHLRAALAKTRPSLRGARITHPERSWQH